VVESSAQGDSGGLDGGKVVQRHFGWLFLWWLLWWLWLL
jgi:hypothetical protein